MLVAAYQHITCNLAHLHNVMRNCARQPANWPQNALWVTWGYREFMDGVDKLAQLSS